MAKKTKRSNAKVISLIGITHENNVRVRHVHEEKFGTVVCQGTWCNVMVLWDGENAPTSELSGFVVEKEDDWKDW